MNPILFSKTENDFTTNGLGRIECISCHVVEERNGMLELEMEVPINGKHVSEIEMLSIIGVVTHEGGNVQAFFVYNITKPINGRFSVFGRHISYRLSNIPCTPFSVEIAPSACAQTLSGLKSHAVEECPFNFYTDVTTASSYTQKVPASIRQRLGGVEGSVIDQFGGEYEWDNWDVHLWHNRGRLASATGISLRYGKNITDIRQEEEIAKTVTGIVPYWVDIDGNNLVMLPEVAVYCDNADAYPYHITEVYNFSDKFENKPTVSQLRSVATAYVNSDGFGEPKVNIKVSFVDLWKSEEYKDVAPLEQVKLCDEIYVQFEELGVNAIAKVIKTDYDVLKERYKSIEVGSARTTLVEAITESEATVVDEALINQLTKVSAAISDATAWLTSANGYVVAVKNADGSWKELLFMDTNNPETAVNVLRINNNGLGFSTSGISGPYTNAWTIDGNLVASFIKVGILGDRANRNYWNMETGEFSLNANTTVGGSTVQAIADAAQAAAEETAQAALASAVLALDGDIADLQNQIDGNITSWFYNYTPTTSNEPASLWTTVDEKINHIGDLFYFSAKGYCYRWQVKTTAADPTHPTANDFEWVKISDEDISAALSVAQAAQDTADHKRRIFITQPTTPYDEGDTWMMGTTGDIKTCIVSRASGAFVDADWSKLNKYTDDSSLETFIGGTYASDKTSLQTQIDGKIETWYQETDPATLWTTAELKEKHVGDLWYKTTNNTTWRYNYNSSTQTYSWTKQDAPDEVFDAIDGKAQIFTSQPTTPYRVGDLWCEGANGDIKTCITARASGSFNASDWAKRNKYTDDSALTTWLNGTYASDKEALEQQIDGKIETFYQQADPSLSWTTAALKSEHTGDIWYNTATGECFRWSGTAWVEMTANPPQEVFNEINGKAQIFVSQPTPPYAVGDLWFEGASGDIKTCTNARSTGSYTASDWVKYNKYTDDSALTTWLSGTYASDKALLEGQIDGKAETWYQDSDPSSTWTTTALKDKHLGDLWYKTLNGENTTWYYTKENNTYKWKQENVPKAVFDSIDGKAQIFTSTPTTPYSVGDLWFNSASSDIMTCINARSTGNYAASDWQKRNKYTDDSAITSFISGTYATDKANLQSQIDGKAETFYQSTDPSADWVGEETGLQLSFDEQSETETNYDYLKIYYENEGSYDVIKLTGSIGGAVVRIPTKDFYLYWVTDSSEVRWGWKITVVKYAGSSFTTPDFTGQSLPSYLPKKRGLTQLETEHPYSNGLNDLYSIETVFNHEGDLWYNTNNDTTWYFDGAAWVQQNVPESVFDKIDGKAQIFTSTPVPPYSVGDLWFGSTSTEIKVCTTAKAEGQSYSSADWVKRDKYVDSSDISGAISSYDTGLDQTAVFDKLTNNQANQGIYIHDGQLYINASMIAAGYMSANYIKAGALQSENYAFTSGNQFIDAGAWLNLENGNLFTYGMSLFGDDTEYDAAYFRRVRIKPNNNSDNEDHFLSVESRTHVATLSADGLLMEILSTAGRNTKVAHDYVSVADDSDHYCYHNYNNLVKVDFGTAYGVQWSTSDKRAKKNIKALSVSLSIQLIDGTKPKKFKFKGKEGTHYGVIAQEARALLDELGEEDAQLEHSMDIPKEFAKMDDQRTIDYNEYIPHLINYVKDLRAEIESLKAEIKALKGEQK